MNRKNLKAIILAAGLSSRMRKFKPLLEVENTTIIEMTINNYKKLGIDEILVVTGFRGHELEERLAHYNITFLKNSDYKNTHMFDSVCIGLEKIKGSCDFVFITPGDSPFVQEYSLKKMMEEIKKDDIKLIQPSFQGKNGHPLLLDMAYLDEILNHDGQKGLQGALENMAGVINRPFIDPGIILDADRPKDYFKIIEFNEDKSCPSLKLCGDIQDYFQMSEDVKAHSDKVLMLALDISNHLYKRGLLLNKKIIMASCLLHDIAKGRPQHAKLGGDWLEDMGYIEIAQIVKEHMELQSIPKVPMEKEVVYLADKMVIGHKVVTIDERFSSKETLYRDKPKVLERIKHRKNQAIEVYNLIYKGESYETN